MAKRAFAMGLGRSLRRSPRKGDLFLVRCGCGHPSAGELLVGGGAHQAGRRLWRGPGPGWPPGELVDLVEDLVIADPDWLPGHWQLLG